MKLQTLPQWLKTMQLDKSEGILHKGTVPKHYVAINSESDSEEESELWDRLCEYFGDQCYNPDASQITALHRDGEVVFFSGEMTWTIFIDPSYLKQLSDQWSV